MFVYKALCLYKNKVCIQLAVLKLEKSVTARRFKLHVSSCQPASYKSAHGRGTDPQAAFGSDSLLTYSGHAMPRKHLTNKRSIYDLQGLAQISHFPSCHHRAAKVAEAK